MGAEALGRRLLGEVEEARLDEVLRSVSLSAQSDEGRFGIRPLDRLLRLFEQQQQQQQQQRHEPGPPPLGQAQRPRVTTTAAPPIIELTSANPGAGKTQLLYLLITHAILPRTYDGIPLSSSSSSSSSSSTSHHAGAGGGGAVVVIDADNRFSAARLAAVARSHVWRRAQMQKQKKRQLTPAAVDGLIAASLAHVHVLQPQQSHAALLAALRALPAYLFAKKGEGLLHGSAACRPLRAVFVDSVSAFFWPLRAAEDDARVLVCSGGGGMSGGEGGKSGKSSTTSEAYAALARELRGLSARFGCVVVATSVAAASPFSSAASSASSERHRHHHPALRPLLPASWHAGGGLLRLGVERVRVRGFAPAMSVAEARAERSQRQGVVEEGRFGVWVDGWGAEAWPRGLWEGLGALEGRGRWGFYVRGDEVVVEGEGEDGGEGEEGVVDI